MAPVAPPKRMAGSLCHNGDAPGKICFRNDKVLHAMRKINTLETILQTSKSGRVIPSARADITLQPVEKTMVEQIFLAAHEEHTGAHIHTAAHRGPKPGQVDIP